MNVLIIAMIWGLAVNMAASTRVRVSEQLDRRLGILKEIGLSKSLESSTTCSDKYFVKITEHKYGKSGNILIEFTHGLWLANVWNATLIIPRWMRHILFAFNLSAFKQSFCYTDNPQIESAKEVIEVNAVNSFFMFKVFSNQRYSGILPFLNEETLASISDHFVRCATS